MRLWQFARQSRDNYQARRWLALASIYDGGSRSEAARLGNVTVKKRPGSVAIRGFRISIDETTLGSELKALGLATLSACSRHYVQNGLKGELFKETSQPH